MHRSSRVLSPGDSDPAKEEEEEEDPGRGGGGGGGGTGCARSSTRFLTPVRCCFSSRAASWTWWPFMTTCGDDVMGRAPGNVSYGDLLIVD